MRKAITTLIATLQKHALIFVGAMLLSACAAVPPASVEQTMFAKSFPAPSAGKAAVYIFRDSFLGAGLKKDVWINGYCVGETAAHTFFHVEVPGNATHHIATESEFSPNVLQLYMYAGQRYFIRQYIKMGVFVGGANLELVDENTGRAAIMPLQLAAMGHCSRPNP